VGDETGEDTRVLDAARRLFAGLGYDGTTTEMIATAAGVPPSAVEGGKAGLYRAILEDFYTAQMKMFDEVEAGYRSDGGDLHRAVDRFLDFYLDHPEGLAVWLYRGLLDAVDVEDVEERFRRPLTHRLFEIFDTLESIPDPETWISAFSWCITGFLNGGILTRETDPLTVADPAARRRFRAFMHRLTGWASSDGP